MKEIFERRSIRKYTDEPISAEHEEKLLRAAMQAPSAIRSRPSTPSTVICPKECIKNSGKNAETPPLGGVFIAFGGIVR